MKRFGMIAVFVVLLSQNVFAGGTAETSVPQEYAALSANSPSNNLFFGSWRESARSSSSQYDVFEFRQDGTGFYTVYDAGGFEKRAPVAINYRTSSQIIIVRYSVSGNYDRFNYSFSTDFNTLTIKVGDSSFKYNKVVNQQTPQTAGGNQNTVQSVPPAVQAPPPLPASVKYTVSINGQSYGPYEMDQLRQMVQQGSLTRETLVWKEGMAQWVAAGTVQELSVLFGTNNPPPLPPPPAR